MSAAQTFLCVTCLGSGLRTRTPYLGYGEIGAPGVPWPPPLGGAERGTLAIPGRRAGARRREREGKYGGTFWKKD